MPCLLFMTEAMNVVFVRKLYPYLKVHSSASFIPWLYHTWVKGVLLSCSLFHHHIARGENDKLGKLSQVSKPTKISASIWVVVTFIFVEVLIITIAFLSAIQLYVAFYIIEVSISKAIYNWAISVFHPCPSPFTLSNWRLNISSSMISKTSESMNH